MDTNIIINTTIDVVLIGLIVYVAIIGILINYRLDSIKHKLESILPNKKNKKTKNEAN